MNPKKLVLSQTNKRIFGVCGGIGEYFLIDPTLIRILLIIATVLFMKIAFIILILYFACFATIPNSNIN